MGMKQRMLLISAIVCVGLLAYSLPAGSEGQSGPVIAGDWLGTLKVSGIELRLVVHISTDEEGNLSATMDSPDQGATGIPVDRVSFAGDSLDFQIDIVAGRYSGILQPDGNTIDGAWSQPAGTFPLMLERMEKPIEINRPQEPKPPFPYEAEDVTFSNQAAGITLAGTLTLPRGEGPFPAVLLISGSGPQDRDETVFSHKPFLVIADYLTRRGIAVLRVDDRGVGKSSGDFASATSADFAGDVLAGIDYLKSREEINHEQIGLIGHSEGGLIAPMVADRSKDVAFLVLLAGPGLPGEDILLMQSDLISRVMGVDEELIAKTRELSKRIFEIVKEESDSTTTADEVREVLESAWESYSEAERSELEKLEGDPEQAIERNVMMVTSPWFRFFISYDPRPALRQVKVPVLALNGEKDMQVPAKQDLQEIETALHTGGNDDVTVKELPGLNHLFQTAETGAPSEYAKIEETFSPIALEIIANWILERTGHERSGG